MSRKITEKRKNGVDFGSVTTIITFSTEIGQQHSRKNIFTKAGKWQKIFPRKYIYIPVLHT